MKGMNGEIKNDQTIYKRKIISKKDR